MPRVSILIPTYARPAHLRGCIEAALSSDYEDIEVIVGDDGILGAPVCGTFADARLRYLRNSHRLGMSQNWNSLLDAAEGDLLALCMDDDRLAPNYVTACVEAFDRDNDLGIVFTNHGFIDHAGSERVRDTLIAPGRHDDFSREFITYQPVAVSAAMIRRQAWRDARPLPDTAAADVVLFGRLAEHGWPFYYIDRDLMTYGTHAGMLSRTPGFRTDAIVAWSSLSFGDPAAEARRRRVLGEAHLSRAKLLLQEGDRASARADLDRAREFGVLEPRHRAAGVRLAAGAPLKLLAGTARLRRAVRARLSD